LICRQSNKKFAFFAYTDYNITGISKKEQRMKERIEAALDKIRPMLMADGGNVDLVEVTQDGIVKLKLTGTCGCCPMSQMTLKMGIEKLLKEEVPEIKEVIAI
jgi:Fe-S cluster biogenesis protein NfuA